MSNRDGVSWTSMVTKAVDHDLQIGRQTQRRIRWHRGLLHVSTPQLTTRLTRSLTWKHRGRFVSTSWHRTVQPASWMTATSLTALQRRRSGPHTSRWQWPAQATQSTPPSPCYSHLDPPLWPLRRVADCPRGEGGCPRHAWPAPRGVAFSQPLRTLRTLRALLRSEGSSWRPGPWRSVCWFQRAQPGWRCGQRTRVSRENVLTSHWPLTSHSNSPATHQPLFLSLARP